MTRYLLIAAALAVLSGVIGYYRSQALPASGGRYMDNLNWLNGQT